MQLQTFMKMIRNNQELAKEMSIAWISTNPNANTGYAIQTKEVVGRLRKKGYNIICIAGGGKNDWSPNHEFIFSLSNGEKVTIPVLPTYGKGSGHDQWEEYKKKYGFDLLITLWDSFIINEYAKYAETVEGIHHIPVDTSFTEKMFIMMKHANKILAMSKYGYQELLKWFPIQKIDYLSHGIDTKIYRPYSQEKIFELRKKTGLKEQDTLFLCVAANAGIRKRIPDLLKIFATATKGKENIYLYLFTNYSVPYYIGFDIHGLCKDLGIEDNIIVPDYDTFRHPQSVQEMVDIYNMADCYVSAAQGEGFGLPILEAMSCGIPVLVSNNSTMPELINYGKNGWLVKNVPEYAATDYMFGIPTNQEYPLPDRYLFRKEMQHVINNPEERKEKGNNARAFVVKNYDWEMIIPQWEHLIQRQIEKIVMKYQIQEEMTSQEDEGER